MKVFISHSSKDIEIASSIINLLEKSMSFSDGDIRCSSIDGYRLPGGVSTDEMLRIEVHDAEMSIGLITPNSLKSLYVAFELGARWGAGKPMVPLLASGVTPDDLEGPLAGINALSCENESQLNQLVEETSARLEMPLRRSSVFVKEIKSVVETSAASKTNIEEQWVTNLFGHISIKEKNILLEATERGQGTIQFIRAMGGTVLSAGQINERLEDRRSEAEWESAIRQLETNGWVIDHSGSGTTFEVTGEGYAIADELRRQGGRSELANRQSFT